MKTLVGTLGIAVVLLVLTGCRAVLTPSDVEATTDGYNVVELIADNEPKLRPMIAEAMADGKLMNEEVLAIIRAKNRLSMTACLEEEGE